MFVRLLPQSCRSICQPVHLQCGRPSKLAVASIERRLDRWNYGRHRRSDGASELCDAGSRPAPLASCTPTDSAVCGAQPPTTQTTSLDNACGLSSAIGAACGGASEGQYCVVSPLF